MYVRRRLAKRLARKKKPLEQKGRDLPMMHLQKRLRAYLLLTVAVDLEAPMVMV